MKPQLTKTQRPLLRAVSLPVAILATCVWLTSASQLASAAEPEASRPKDDREYTKDFNLKHRTFTSRGESLYFILKPGFQLVLEGQEGGKTVVFVTTVSNKTEKIDVPGIGVVETRVIDEKEWADGKPIEVAKSYFAMCAKSGDVFDFGDSVDVIKEDGSVVHEGTWRAGQPDADGIAMPGLFMPGSFLLGARYYQQMADGLSSERAENSATGLSITTKAGKFENCIKVSEHNEVEAEHVGKFHAPGVGLIKEDTLELVAYGYDIFDIEKGKLKATGKKGTASVDALRNAPAVRKTTPARQTAPVRKITDDRAKSIALKQVPGEVTHIGLERKLGKQTIVAEVLDKDGGETDVIIDMETGEVLGTEK